jgi:hypothetical protein
LMRSTIRSKSCSYTAWRQQVTLVKKKKTISAQFQSRFPLLQPTQTLDGHKKHRRIRRRGCVCTLATASLRAVACVTFCGIWYVSIFPPGQAQNERTQSAEEEVKHCSVLRADRVGNLGQYG